MQTYRLTIHPRSAFGTPVAGDTLFGQLCWAVRERFGEIRLTNLLEGYTAGSPFLVVSDAFPANWLPRPQLPDFLLGLDIDPAKRKAAKQKVWLPTCDAGLELGEWLERAQALSTMPHNEAAQVTIHHGKGAETSTPWIQHQIVTQNTINRLTGTTGTGPFAPRQVSRISFGAGSALDIYCVVDTSRLSLAELTQIFTDIGQTGFGRDASTGLGKFTTDTACAHEWSVKGSQHALTLGPCAPEPEALRAEFCFYQPLTRFGRHGNLAAVTGKPFKRPVMTMRSGAFLSFCDGEVPAFHGTGLGGVHQPLSAAIPATVHQGYTPLVPLKTELSQ